MPRNTLQRSNTLPYHVTARANNKDPFPIPLKLFWKVLSDECLFLTYIYSVKIHALVLMPNHFHILITVPERDLGQVMNELMKSVSKSTNRISGRSGHLFGGSHGRTLITDSRYYGHAFKYVYRNPVKALLCEKVEDYPFSTLQGLLGDSHLPFPIHFTTVGMEVGLPSIESSLFLNWLNTAFPNESEKIIQRALKQKLFEIVASEDTKDSVGLLSHLL